MLKRSFVFAKSQAARINKATVIAPNSRPTCRISTVLLRSEVFAGAFGAPSTAAGPYGDGCGVPHTTRENAGLSIASPGGEKRAAAARSDVTERGVRFISLPVSMQSSSPKGGTSEEGNRARSRGLSGGGRSPANPVCMNAGPPPSGTPQTTSARSQESAPQNGKDCVFRRTWKRLPEAQKKLDKSLRYILFGNRPSF